MKKRIALFHNPDAGSSDHSQKDLREKIESAGFSVIFSTTDAENMKKTIPDMTDFVVIAGGDGMVRKVVSQMLDRSIIDGQFPLAIIPLGTANNIAKTLGLCTDVDKAIKSWKKFDTKRIDVGKIGGLKSVSFFIEGMGFGLIPNLITEMKQKDKADDPEEELKAATEKLLCLSKKLKPQMCTLQVDNESFKGDLLMLEVMNMKCVGPNLPLSPKADPSDGSLEVVYIHADERDHLTDFVEAKMDGADIPLNARVLSGSRIQLASENGLVHVDDKVHEARKEGLSIDLRPGLLEFLV